MEKMSDFNTKLSVRVLINVKWNLIHDLIKLAKNSL